MSKIINIGLLDVSEIKEDLAKEISEISNVGLLIESDDSQLLLRDCKKINIGSSIKLPSDIAVKVVSVNGEIEIDQEYLEGIIDPIALLVNGLTTFSNDIDKELLNKKIFTILVNGILITPKNLSSIIQTKGQINGKVNVYKSNYIYFDKAKITNRVLKNLKPSSKLAINNLILIEDIDEGLLKKKISNIQILENLIILEKYDDLLAEIIDEYYDVDLKIIPIGKGNVKYIEEDILIDDNSIKSFSHNTLYVDGDVTINLSSEIDIKNYIDYVICSKLICNNKTYNMIKDIINENIEVEIVEGKLIKNVGKLIFSSNFMESTSIINMGKIVFNDTVDPENIKKYLVSLTNFGSIEAPQNLLDIINSKTVKSFGKIKALEEKKEIENEENTDIMYSNAASLKL